MLRFTKKQLTYKNADEARSSGFVCIFFYQLLNNSSTQALLMIVVRNRFLPFPGFYAINILGIIFVRKDLNVPGTLSRKDYEQLLLHEYIHSLQMRELLFLPFYLLYGLEWMFRLCQHRHLGQAYRSISFEREAYAHQHDVHYPRRRRRFAFRHWY